MFFILVVKIVLCFNFHTYWRLWKYIIFNTEFSHCTLLDMLDLWPMFCLSVCCTCRSNYRLWGRRECWRRLVSWRFGKEKQWRRYWVVCVQLLSSDYQWKRKSGYWLRKCNSIWRMEEEESGWEQASTLLSLEHQMLAKAVCWIFFVRHNSPHRDIVICEYD